MEIEIQNNQLIIEGYDHCWVLNDYGEGIRKIAEARVLIRELIWRFILINGVQFYTGNFLGGSLKSKKLKNEKRSGLSRNTTLSDSLISRVFLMLYKPDKKYQTQTWYKFSTKTY